MFDRTFEQGEEFDVAQSVRFGHLPARFSEPDPEKYLADYVQTCTKHGLEVDFVLYGENGMVAIEVKRSRTLGPKDLRGLREFKKDYRECDCYIIYGGNDIQYLDHATALPIDQASTYCLQSWTAASSTSRVRHV